MDWREKALTGILLILLILSLTFGPIWSMAFPILLGMIASAVSRAVEMIKKKPILPVSDPAPAFPILLGMIASAVTRAVEMMKTKPILPVSDPAPAVDAPAPAVDALALSVDAPVDALAPSVDAPAPAFDALALSVDAPAPAVDALVLSVDAPALSVDASVDAPVLAVDALAPSVDAPVDASALAPAVVAAGIRRRRKPISFVSASSELKLVLRLAVRTHRDKVKAMKVVSRLGGVSSVKINLEDNTLTVFGDFDPVKVVHKLRKSWLAEIVSVGPATEDDGNRNENPEVQAYQEEENPNRVIC